MSGFFRRPGFKALLIVIVKLCLSAAFFYWIWTALPGGTQWMDLDLAHPSLLAICIVAAVLQIALLAFRWLMTTNVIATGIEGLPALRFYRFFQLMWLSQAISQVLPALVGGDGFRIAGLRYDGVPLSTSTASVLVDRVFGLAGLVALILPGVAAGGLLASLPMWVFVAAAILAAASVAGYVLARGRLGRIIRLAGCSFEGLTGRRGLAILVMSIAGHAISVLIFQLMADAYGLGIPLSTTLIVFPAALLMSILPISFGGWGVREASVVFGLSLYGIPEHDALLASLLFGTFQLVAAIPSVVGFFSWARRIQK